MTPHIILFPLEFVLVAVFTSSHVLPSALLGKEIIQQWLVAISEWTRVEPQLTPPFMPS